MGGVPPADLAAEADVILAVGTRLGDFTTASRSLFQNPSARLIQLNVADFDVAKHGARPLVSDARRGLEALGEALGDWRAPAEWTRRTKESVEAWNEVVARLTAATNVPLPSDAQVLGAANRAAGSQDAVVCAADTDPAVSTAEGGAWWDVVVPEVSDRPEVKSARKAYVKAASRQIVGR